jgi:hypothetical protein
MNVSSLVTVVTAVAACGGAGAALWGLRYAKGLIDTAVSDRQVDRVLALHHEWTTGEVGAARVRFSELMYRAGEEAFGPRKCWRPDWESLIPPNPAVHETLSPARFLGAYPDDMISGRGNRPIHDLRQVLWCFDRINEARKKASLLDEKLLVSLMGHSALWWNLLCGRLAMPEGSHGYSLMQLASWIEEMGWREDPRNEYRKMPEGDFPCREDEVPIPRISTSWNGSSGGASTHERPQRATTRAIRSAKASQDSHSRD